MGKKMTWLLTLILLVFNIIASQNTFDVSQINEGLSWFNYRNLKQNRTQLFHLSYPQGDEKIYFDSINRQEIQLKKAFITEDNIWGTFYENQNFQIKTISVKKNLMIQLIPLQNKKQKLNFSLYLKNTSNVNFQYSLKQNQNTLHQHQLLNLMQLCKKSSQTPQIIKCEAVLDKKITFFFIFQNQGQFRSLIQNTTEIDSKANQSYEQFISNYKLKQASIDDVQNAMAYTFSSFCFQESQQYEGERFYGLCTEKNKKLNIDLHFSPLIIEILLKYNSKIGLQLVENLIKLLEEKLFYSYSSQEWVSIPQHIELFQSYLKTLHSYRKSFNLSQYLIKQKIDKVLNVQNGFLTKMLLQDVNHIAQQINYRQNKQVHPTILKMLTQKWNTNSLRARTASLYMESFTHDFYYHNKNEHLVSSVGKMMWLINLLNSYIRMIEVYGDNLQKEQLQQLYSLNKVLKGYVLDEPRAKEGNFVSIVLSQKQKVYSRSIGYESLLPFVYQISPVFPKASFNNLTTPHGLASLPTNHQKVDQRYDFRGNINLYFNYKILFKTFALLRRNPSFKAELQQIRQLILRVKSLILTFKEQLKQHKKHIFYTSWSISKKGVKSEPMLAILNVMCMVGFE